MRRLDATTIKSGIARRLGYWRHMRVARHVMDTPALRVGDDGIVIFSMLGTSGLQPYLVAVKSLHRHLRRGRIVIMDDGTLTDRDRAILNDHCDRPEFVDMDSIDTGNCPKGNCWERLHHIMTLRRENYVIQLDSDTVTLDQLKHVDEAIDANRSFTLAGGIKEAEYGFQSMAEMARTFYPHEIETQNVQQLAEMAMALLPDSDKLRYTRGSAGFAGFSKQSEGRDELIRFSEVVEGRIGRKWHDWGSEQVASNFVVANDTDPVLLPYDRYVNHWAEPLPPNPGFIHFIGTYRYARGDYSRATQRAIAHLNSPYPDSRNTA